MQYISVYLNKTVIQVLLLLIFLLLILEVFIILISQFSELGIGNYHFNTAFLYAILKAPQALYSIFPVISLLSILIGLGMHAHNNELLILRMTGVSIFNLIQKISFSIFLMIILGLVLGEWIVPKGEEYALHLKTIATTQGKALKTMEGMWLKDQSNFLHIDEVISSVYLKGVSYYLLNSKQYLYKIQTAAYILYKKNKWEAHQVNISDILRDKVQFSYKEKVYWPLAITPMILKTLKVDPRFMTLAELYDIIAYRNKIHLSYTQYTVLFLQRLLQPIAMIIMVFLGVPCVLGPLRTATMGWRIFSGVILGFMFYLLQSFALPLGLVLKISPLLTVMFPLLLFMLLAAVLILKVP